MLRFLLILIALVVLLRLLGWTPPGRRQNPGNQNPGNQNGGNQHAGRPDARRPPAGGQDAGYPGSAAGGRDRSAADAGLELVRCAHCRVFLPPAQALRQGSHWYCSEPHRTKGPAAAGSAGPD